MAKKKLTLDETWKYCLQMWKWIVEQIKNGNNLSLSFLKYEWLRQNGFASESVRLGCFFCEYREKSGLNCEEEYGCPAQKIDKTFDCVSPHIHYSRNPEAFYAELLRLNKIRKGKKAKVKRG